MLTRRFVGAALAAPLIGVLGRAALAATGVATQDGLAITGYDSAA